MLYVILNALYYLYIYYVILILYYVKWYSQSIVLNIIFCIFQKQKREVLYMWPWYTLFYYYYYYYLLFEVMFKKYNTVMHIISVCLHLFVTLVIFTLL